MDNSSDPRYPVASAVPSASGQPPAPPVHPVVVQSAGHAKQAPSNKYAPRRLRSPADVDTALISRHPAWVPHLIRALGSRNAQLQGRARQALPVFGDAAMIALLRAAAHERGTIREEAVGCLGEWGDVRALQPLLLALKHDRRDRNAHLAFRFVVAVLGSMFARNPHEIDALWTQVRSENRLRVRACAGLGNLGDVRAITPLVEMARSQDPEVAQAARQALVRLLPIVVTLPPDKARVLGTEGVPALMSLLYDRDEPLVRLILAALRVAGDQRALPGIQRLAQDCSRPFVQQEAASLLVLLHDRATQQQARMTLLRQSHAPQTRTPDALLHPADSPAHSYPDELLRGSQTRPQESKNKHQPQ